MSPQPSGDASLLWVSEPRKGQKGGGEELGFPVASSVGEFSDVKEGNM